jgi:IclR family transcriptional regulator, acetate operon repressor
VWGWPLRFGVMSDPTAVSERGAPVPTVARILDVLELLADAPTGVTVLELAHELAVHKSVSSRILATLLQRGYVVRDEGSDRHELSLKFFALASRNTNRMGFPAFCQPTLQALADEIEELVQLSVVEREGLVVTAFAQTPDRRRLAVWPALGTVLAPHASASGKVWLASMPDDQAVAIALRHGLAPLTASTITTLDRLVHELERTRVQGYGIAENEWIDDISAIAFGIGQNRFGGVVGAITLSAPTARTSRARLVEIASRVQRAAADLETIWPTHAVRLAGRV